MFDASPRPPRCSRLRRDAADLRRAMRHDVAITSAAAVDVMSLMISVRRASLCADATLARAGGMLAQAGQGRQAGAAVRVGAGGVYKAQRSTDARDAPKTMLISPRFSPMPPADYAVFIFIFR